MALAVNKLVQAVYTAFAYTNSKFIQTEKAYIGHIAPMPRDLHYSCRKEADS